MTPRFGFVIGTGRCGSSLVHEVIARHPEVGFVSNVDDRLAALRLRGRLNRSVYERVPPGLTEKGRVRFAPSEAYRLLDREVSPLISDPPRDLVAADAAGEVGARFADFFRRRAEAQRVPLFVHKFTGWPRLGFIDAALPRTRFIHIVRDGRAVAASWLRMPWWRGRAGPEGWHFGPLPEPYAAEWDAAGRSQVVLAGIAWKLLLDATDEAHDVAGFGGDRWLELRYEDVVAAPEPSFAAMLDFLELRPVPAFSEWLSRYDFAPASLERVEADLGRESTEALTASLSTHLARRGYKE